MFFSFRSRGDCKTEVEKKINRVAPLLTDSTVEMNRNEKKKQELRCLALLGAAVNELHRLVPPSFRWSPASRLRVPPFPLPKNAAVRPSAEWKCWRCNQRNFLPQPQRFFHLPLPPRNRSFRNNSSTPGKRKPCPFQLYLLSFGEKQLIFDFSTDNAQKYHFSPISRTS